jgi:hypothetical protein
VAPININFLSNTRDLIRGTDDVEKALEGVSDSLDDLAKDGKKTGDKLGDGLKDGAKEGDAATEKLERSFSELADKAKKESKQAGDALGDNIKRGAREAESGVGEFKDEVNSTAREAAASFGSVEDGVDAIQEVLANALAGFGPVGAAIGLAVAAGLGVAITQGQASAEAINNAKERTGELANEIAEVGGDITKIDLASKFREWGVEIADTKEFYELWQTSAVSNVEKVQQSARDLNVDFETLFRGLSGYDEEARAGALAQLKDNLADVEEQMVRNRDVNMFAGFSDNAALDARTTALKNQISELEAVNDIVGDAEDADRALSQAVKDNADALDYRNEKLRDTQDAATEAARAEIDYQAQIGATAEVIKENGKETDNATEKGRANNAALLDLVDSTRSLSDAQKVNGAATEASNAATTAGREAFLKAADAAGYTAERAVALADKYGLIPEVVSTAAEVTGIPKAEADLDALTRQRDLAISVGADRSPYDREIQRITNEKIVKTIEVVTKSLTGSGRIGVP